MSVNPIFKKLRQEDSKSFPTPPRDPLIFCLLLGKNRLLGDKSQGLGGLEGGETLIKICWMRKKNLFSINKNKKIKKLILKLPVFHKTLIVWSGV